MQLPNEQSTSLPQPQGAIDSPHKKVAAIVVVKHTILNTMIIHYSEDNLTVRWLDN
jgi:hypothetical protein